MGIRDLFKRRKTTDIGSPIGMGDEDGDKEIGEGGPSFYKEEIAEYRWAAQHEAVNIARRGVDPERWDQARMAFDWERGIGHGHEALRDRLANFVGQRVRDEVRELYSLAGDVALVRDQLRTVDEQLVRVNADFNAKHAEVCDDELELSRYYRLRSLTGRTMKYVIAAIFVFGELVISGRVFERIFVDLPPGFGYILAFGTTLALIIIPHYSALGLKEGLTQYHIFEKQALEKANKEVPFTVERAVHFEEKDDQGFRRAAVLVGVGLLVMIAPLSWLRATSDGGRFSWAEFLFLMLLQYALSGYFFLREWLDHGPNSHSLYHLHEERDQAIKRREGVLADLADATAAFHDEARDLIFTLEQAPRWDSHIVESYYETLRYFRHLISLEQPDFEQFITWARVPYLGSKTSAAESDYPLDPLSEEHRSLDEDGPLGREHLFRLVGKALNDSSKANDDQVGDDPSWLVTNSPDALLAKYLRRNFDIDLDYKRPAALTWLDPDPEPTVAPESQPPMAPDGTTSDDVDRSLQKLLADADAGRGDDPERPFTS